MKKMDKKDEIMLVNHESLVKKIYIIRGQKVMLDFELAEIYGYETKRFNEQVKRNIEKFDEDFMFQLTDDEVSELSRSQNATLNKSAGRGSNIKHNPHAFTEQGIYMLMTVLKGELAVKQSKALIRTFKQMKDYIVENQGVDWEKRVFTAFDADYEQCCGNAGFKTGFKRCGRSGGGSDGHLKQCGA